MVLTFLKFAFGTCSYGICLESRHLVLGLQVHSTRVIRYSKVPFLSKNVQNILNLTKLIELMSAVQSKPNSLDKCSPKVTYFHIRKAHLTTYWKYFINNTLIWIGSTFDKYCQHTSLYTIVWNQLWAKHFW